MGAGKPLAAGETGPYLEITARPLPPPLVLLFMPSLAALVARAEELKGETLSQAEVLRIRDHAPVLVSDPEPARAVQARRGYTDLDAADPWASWLALREQSE